MPQTTLTGPAAGAAGTITLTFRPRGTDTYRVSQVSPELVQGTAANMPPAASGALRLNGRLVAPFVPTGDAIGGDPPLYVGPTDEMTVEWINVLSGNQASAVVFYDRVQGR
jgi:hypothetical protein